MMKVYNMSESRIDEELLARGSRTSGSLQQKEDRLQRFLDIENQKQRRFNSILDAQAAQAKLILAKEEEDGEVALNLGEAFDLEAERAASALLSLRNTPDGVLRRLARLERIVDSMDRRITELETADMPPLTPILQDSNPNWVYDDSTSPYAWECTKFD